MNINIIIYLIITIASGSICATIASHLLLSYERNMNKEIYKDVNHKRSICENCKTILSWYHLIPIISYILLLWKCWSCWSKINRKYFTWEIVAFIVWVFISSIIIQNSIFILFDMLLNNKLMFIINFFLAIFMSSIWTYMIFWKGKFEKIYNNFNSLK